MNARMLFTSTPLRVLVLVLVLALAAFAAAPATAAGEQFIPVFTGREIAGPAGTAAPAEPNF